MKESEKGVARKTMLEGKNSKMIDTVTLIAGLRALPFLELDIFDCFRVYTRLFVIVFHPLRVDNSWDRE